MKEQPDLCPHSPETLTRLPVSFPLLVTWLLATLAIGIAQTPPSIPGRSAHLPLDASVSLGASVTFEVKASGDAPLIYQWRHEEVPIDTATHSNVTLTDVGLSHAGGYDVVVSNGYGSVTSRVALLTVDPTFIKITSGEVVDDEIGSVQGAWGDYDGDDDLDLVVAGGYWDTSGAIHSALYRNDAGVLRKVGGGPLAESRDRCAFLAWADYDNDGDVDLVVGVHEAGVVSLYVNQGSGHFILQRTLADWIVNGVEVRGSRVLWGDQDSDGLLDLMVMNRASQGGVASVNTLLRNAGGGLFEADRSTALALSGTDEETAAWVDIDGDGDLDFSSIEMSDPQGLRRLYRNLGGGQFEPIPDSLFWGNPAVHLGHAWADFDNDGDLDVAACSNGDDTIFVNDGNGNLSEIDLPGHGLASDIGGYPSWSDYDNDGHLDLLCTAYGARGHLFHNRGDGTFEEVLTGSIVNEIADNIAASWGDYDNDGYLDLFMARSTTGNRLFLNNHEQHLADQEVIHHWLRIELQGTASSRSGIGAKVYVETTIGGQAVRQLRQIGGQMLESMLFAHFGLGDATAVDTLRIEWPSGIVQEIKNVAVDQILTLTEPPRLIPQAAGGFQIQCWINQSFDVQSSEDLDSWTVAGTVTNETGTLIFQDPEQDQHTCRYYRVVAK